MHVTNDRNTVLNSSRALPNSKWATILPGYNEGEEQP